MYVRLKNPFEMVHKKFTKGITMRALWHLGVDIGSVHVKVVAISPKGKRHVWIRYARGKALDVLAELFPGEIYKFLGKSQDFI